MTKYRRPLREWFGLRDSATFLRDTLGEPIRERDVLQYALEGRLPLSVHFATETRGVFGRVTVGPTPAFHATDATRTAVVPSGLWDVPLVGAEAALIEHAYRVRARGGRPVPARSGQSRVTTGMGGRSASAKPVVRHTLQRHRLAEVFVRQGEQWCALYAPTDPHGDLEGQWVPASAWPSGAKLAVRRVALDALIASLTTPDGHGALDSRERMSLYKLLAVVLNMVRNPRAAARLAALTKPSQIVTFVARAAEKQGLSLSRKTARHHLLEALGALQEAPPTQNKSGK